MYEAAARFTNFSCIMMYLTMSSQKIHHIFASFILFISNLLAGLFVSRTWPLFAAVAELPTYSMSQVLRPVSPLGIIPSDRLDANLL